MMMLKTVVVFAAVLLSVVHCENYDDIIEELDDDTMDEVNDIFADEQKTESKPKASEDETKAEQIPVAKEEPVKDDPQVEDELAMTEAEDPLKDEPAMDESAKDEPVKDEPAKDEPAKDEPAKDEPAEDEPAKEEPAKDEPAKDQPCDATNTCMDDEPTSPDDEPTSPDDEPTSPDDEPTSEDALAEIERSETAEKAKKLAQSHDEKERAWLKKLLIERRDAAIQAKRERAAKVKRIQHSMKRDQLIAKLAHAIREHKKKKDQEAVAAVQQDVKPELSHDEKEREMLKTLLHERRDEAIEAKRQRPVELKRLEHAEKRDQLITRLAKAIRQRKKNDQKMDAKTKSHDEKEREMLKKLLHERRDAAIQAKRERADKVKKIQHSMKRDQLIAKLAHAIRQHKKEGPGDLH